MKKFFTLIVMCVLAVSAQAKINIYVQCETAPFLWTWGAAGGTFDNVGDWPGSLQFTEKYTHPDTGEEFWMFSFPDEITQISFLFNNGEASGTKQTGDVKDVTSDRYFILSWDDGSGNVSLQDVTEDYTEIPDAEVNTLGISGSHVGWDDPATVYAEIIEAGKTYKYTMDPSGLGNVAVQFKFRPNGVSWMGFWDVYYNADGDAVAGKTSSAEAPEWLEADKDGNFKIDLNKYSATAFTFTMTWNGGKNATDNWTIVAEATDLQKLEPGETAWTVAGVEALCGTAWDPANTANDMAKDTDGLYKLTRTGVALEAGSYDFKVCANHGWAESYGNGDANQTVDIETAGTYDITFTFNAESKEVSATATIATGISTVKFFNTTTDALYNLQGQRVQAGFRGIAIKNGRKFMVK